jgi:periplasmic protein TonB
METSKILSADILDIIFEGKNKEYGAYELRKSYNQRLRNALVITMGIFVLMFLISFISDHVGNTEKPVEMQVKDVTLEEAKKNEPPPPPPPPPPKLPPPPPIKTIQFTPPVIKKDEEVMKPPPEVKQLEEAKVDVKTQEGEKDLGIVAPPVNDHSNVIEVPKNTEDEDRVFTKVEVDAQFPGGPEGWGRYVKKEIERHIDELQEAGESGTVQIRFIVDKEGNVSDVEAVGDMKNSKLAEVAKNAIRRGPKWTPAIQNGRSVKAYRTQPVTFTIQEQ